MRLLSGKRLCPAIARWFWQAVALGYTETPCTEHSDTMGLIKLIILAALVWVALRFWRAMQQQRNTENSASQRPQTDAPVMVRCAQCQVHLPESRALRAGDQWYCCAEHRDEHDNR